MTISSDTIGSALAGLVTPAGVKLSLAPDGPVEIVVTGDCVAASIAIDPQDADRWEPIRREVEARIAGVTGVSHARVSLTAERVAAGPAARQNAEPKSAAATGFANLSQIKHIIAVASGKGGVGKSTTACNIALALVHGAGDGKGKRLRVGVLDADIYGPSMPKLFGLKGTPRIVSGRTLEPMEAFGVKVMSIGFLVDAAKAMVWRGPMVASAVTQLLRDVEWGELDVLVVDMPPGTGDAQLSLAQQAPLAGAVIVSTPQDLALIDARRGVAMFRDVGVPILGLVENMSYFVCDDCGKRHHIFAHGGARAESAKLCVPFLGEIPLDLAIRERSDAGLPIVLAEPEGQPARAYRQIAAAIWLGVADGV